MPHILGKNRTPCAPFRTAPAKMCHRLPQSASVGPVSNTHRGVSPTSFFTDHYELTMVDAARKAGTADASAVFHLFGRRMASGRSDGVSAGLGRFLEGLSAVRCDDEHLAFLSDRNVVSEGTINWLSNYTCAGDLYAYAEGEPYFPSSPL